MTLKDFQTIQKSRFEGAATFKTRCESHKDFETKPKEVMQFVMDELFNQQQQNRGR